MTTWGEIQTWGMLERWGNDAKCRLVHPTYKVIYSRMNNHTVAYTVVRKADDSFENVVDFKADDPRWADAQAVYLGGRQYDLTEDEITDLAAAGYTVEWIG